MEKDYLTVEEIAKNLDLSEDTIRAYIRNGQLKAYRFGHVYRVQKTDYEQWLRSRLATEDDNKNR